MFNIIVTSIVILLLVLFIYLFRQFYMLKKGYDEVLVKIMQDHQAYIKSYNAITKEFKYRYDDLTKLIKDINITRNNLKTMLDNLHNKLKNIT